ncbi:hypothetical protein ACLB2K_019872 [Fragaria x ananassa]
MYKIVITLPDSHEGFQVSVHTIGADQRRIVANTTIELPTLDEGDTVFRAYENGNIYWLGSNGVLWSFEVEEKTDGVLEGPDLYYLTKEGDGYCVVNLKLLKQSLCLLVGIRGDDSQIHVLMKKSVVNDEINQVIWKNKFAIRTC